MIPILFLDHAAAMGGAERSLLLILRHLAPEKWQPHLAGVGGPLFEQAGLEGVETHPVTFPRLRGAVPLGVQGLASVGAIAQLARQTGAALIYANTARAAFYGAAASQMARRPFVWHMRDFWLSEARPRRPWADRLLKKLLCLSAACLVTNSQATAAHLPPGCNPTVIPNAIEVARFDPGLEAAPFRARYGIPQGAPLAGMVGRLRPWKGQARFLRAMAGVADVLPEARFLIVGGAIFGVPDAYETRLHNLAHELGLAERVLFTGQLEDVRPALAALDIFIHPGDPEPFGLVNLEAMAMGKPVVAFAHGALPEIVVHNETGLLVPPLDERALAGAALALLKEPLRARTLGATGRAHVEHHFDAARLAAQIDTLLTGVLK